MDDIDVTISTPGGPPGGPAEPLPGRAGAAARDEAREAGFAESHGAEANRLLRQLPREDYAHLLPRLVPVRLRLKDVLVDVDAPIADVYFVRDGVCSVLSSERVDGPIEVGTVGREGFVGLPVLNGVETTPYRVIVQVAGHGWRLRGDLFREAVDERPALRRLLLRYSQYYTDQIVLSASCNRLHTLEERCARWLLMTHDRVEGDQFEITHEFLAQMLGVRRAGVTVAMGTLQAQGVVRYMRGRVVVLDRGRLEAGSCGCYRITRASLERLLG